MKLNSYDEWTTLREIIVGSAKNYTSHEREISFDLFFHDNLPQRSEWYYPRVSARSSSAQTASRESLGIKQRYVEELNEDLEGITEALKAAGVTVLRPLDLDSSTTEIQTLAWSAAVIPPLNLRDITLIVGNEIIETAPMLRSRYLENQFLTPVFADYFRQGARWTVMPRPLMTDASFDPSYAESTAGGRWS